MANNTFSVGHIPVPSQQQKHYDKVQCRSSSGFIVDSEKPVTIFSKNHHHTYLIVF